MLRQALGGAAFQYMIVCNIIIVEATILFEIVLFMHKINLQEQP